MHSEAAKQKRKQTEIKGKLNERDVAVDYRQVGKVIAMVCNGLTV
jgi:hypothetical protein